MYTKLIFAFLAVGFCTAALFPGEKYITVSDDGTYAHLVSDNGFRVEILKNFGAHGLKDFQIILTGPTFHKVFHLNNQIAGDVIYDLCVRYQGVVDDVTFQKILYKIESYVQQGDLHPKVFFFFQTLIDEEAVQHLIDGQVYGDDHFYGVYGKNYRFPYGVYGQDYSQNFYGKNFYGKNYYNSYPYSAYQGQQYGKLFNYENALYRTQYPYGGKFNYESALYKTYPYGAQYKYGLESQIEHEVEREVEQEVEQKLDSKLYNNYYSQGVPFAQYSPFSSRFSAPRAQQFYGLNPYARQGFFGGSYGRFGRY